MSSVESVTASSRWKPFGSFFTTTSGSVIDLHTFAIGGLTASSSLTHLRIISSTKKQHTISMTDGDWIRFEAKAGAGASKTYPQQAGKAEDDAAASTFFSLFLLRAAGDDNETVLEIRAEYDPSTTTKPKPYQPGYTALPPPPLTEDTAIDICEGWTISGTPLGLHDPRFLAMAAAEHRFLDAGYDEYADSNASTFFSLFLLRAAGFLLRCYIMAWAINILQRRRQREEAASLAANEVAYMLQAGKEGGCRSP